MATIKATCPLCGDVDLAPRQVWWVVEAIDDTDSRRRLRLPDATCSDVEKPDRRGGRAPADPRPASGSTEGPGPGGRPARPTTAGPIGYDDLLDLVLYLETHDAVAEDMGSPSAAEPPSRLRGSDARAATRASADL